MRERLGSIGDDSARERSQRIVGHLRDAQLPRVWIMAYLATRAEPDLDPWLDSPGDGQFCVPRMDWDARTMEPVAFEAAESRIEVRRHGIREPVAGERIALDSIGAVLVPGLAFDRSGDRLGRGAGFYDRFLARIAAGSDRAGRARLIGVSFACQIVDRVPRDDHDIAMDALVTEEGLIDCAPGARSRR